MNKYKKYMLSAIFTAAIILITHFLLASTIRKIYDDRPELSPAPIPYTEHEVNHVEFSSCWGPDKIHDRYFIDKSINEVETYYFNEMKKYCTSDDDTFFTSCNSNTAYNCRSTQCTLKSEQWNVREGFSIEVFEISNTKTLVQQTHSIEYSRKEKCNYPPGE